MRLHASCYTVCSLPHIKIASVVNENALVLLGHIVVTVPLIFLISFCCWFVYDKVSMPVFKWLGKKLIFIDEIISVEE